MYRRVITPSAKRSLKRLSQHAQDALLDASVVLERDPTAGERLHGPLSFLWCFHFKYENVQYRLAYTVDHEQWHIIIHYVGPRENFYHRLQLLFR